MYKWADPKEIERLQKVVPTLLIYVFGSLEICSSTVQ